MRPRRSGSRRRSASTIEPATLAAIRRHGAARRPPVRASGSRRSSSKLLARRAAVGRAAAPGRHRACSAAISPELAAQRGIAQNKIPGEDLWDHTLRTVDAAPGDQPIVRLAALVHDIGKPATAADGHFYGHDIVGADLADGAPRPAPRADARPRTASSISSASTCSAYEPTLGRRRGPAVHRQGRAGALDELFALREADNVGSGVPRDADDLAGSARGSRPSSPRVPILDRSALAIDGDDLMPSSGSRRARRSGGSSTRCSSESSRIRASTTEPR